MFPWVYGFTWQTGNLVFLGIFYAIVAVIFATFIIATRRAAGNLGKSKDFAAISWHDGFAELPKAAKVCRHVMTGELENRVCPNGFDCRVCELHPKLVLERLLNSDRFPPPRNADAMPFGLNMPTDRFYHRGHAWVKKEKDGMLTVGLDDFGRRIIGKPDFVQLPKVGTRLEVNGPGWTFEKDGRKFRILSPVEGKVIGSAYDGNEYQLKVKPENGTDLRHLLKNEEIRPWIMREVERLESLLSNEKIGVSFADGGELVDNPSGNFPEVNWDNVLGEMFLEP